MKACVAYNNGRTHKYYVKIGQGYLCKYVVPWDISRLKTYPGLAHFAVDRRHMMCVDRCLSLIVDFRTSSMVSYGLLLILAPKYTKITISFKTLMNL